MDPIDAAVSAGYLAVLAASAVACARWAVAVTGGDRLERALVAVLVGVAQPVAIGVALGAVGLLRGPAVLGASAVVGVVAAMRTQATEREEVTAVDWLDLAAIAATAGVVGLSFLIGFRDVPSQHVETAHYHYGEIAHLREGGVWSLSFENPGLFTATHPSDVAVFDTVVSFSTGDDRLLYGWIYPGMALLGAVAGAVVARELGGRAAVGNLAALALFVVPGAFFTAHSLATDVVAASALLAGLALLLRARREAAAPVVVLAGVALGLAAGAKYTAFVPVGLAGLGCLAVPALRRRVLWLGPGLAVLLLPWLVRNAIQRDNPLYPLGIRVGGHQVLPVQDSPFLDIDQPMLDHVIHGRGDAIELWIELVRWLYGPLMVVAVVGVAVGVVRAVLRRDVPLAAGAGLGAVAFASYATTPFTGGGVPAQEFLMGSNLRYSIPALLLGVVVASAQLPWKWGTGVVAVLLAWSGWKLVTEPLRPDLDIPAWMLAASLLVAVGIAFAAAPAGAGLRRRVPARLASPVLPAAAAAGMLVVMGVVLVRTVDPRPQSALEQAVIAAADAAGDTTEEVAVLAVTDLHSVIGPAFDREAVRAAPEARVDRSPELIDANLAAVETDVLVIGVGLGAPTGYVPPAEWCPFRTVGSVTVYARLATGCAA